MSINSMKFLFLKLGRIYDMFIITQWPLIHETLSRFPFMSSPGKHEYITMYQKRPGHHCHQEDFLSLSLHFPTSVEIIKTSGSSFVLNSRFNITFCFNVSYIYVYISIKTVIKFTHRIPVISNYQSRRAPKRS